MTAEAFIAWARIARPGSILGPQQFFLVQKEDEYLKTSSPFKKAISMKDKEMSPMDKLKSIKGEDSQGNYLISAKERNSESKNRNCGSAIA
jgi:hypothetical protein